MKENEKYIPIIRNLLSDYLEFYKKLTVFMVLELIDLDLQKESELPEIKKKGFSRKKQNLKKFKGGAAAAKSLSSRGF